jgi:hypothetical protein
MRIRAKAGSQCWLTLHDQTLPVVVRAINCTPRPQPNMVYDVSFEFYQVSASPVQPAIPKATVTPIIPPPTQNNPNPTAPKTKYAYSVAATLNAPGSGNWQGAYQNRSSGEWFVVEAKDNAAGTAEDTILYRFSAAKVYQDSMTFLGGGHQTSMSVDNSNNIWCSFGGNIVRFAYAGGTTISTATTITVPVTGATKQISLSPTRTIACIRRIQTTTETYSVWPLTGTTFGTQTGVDIVVNRANNRVVQGFGVNNNEVRVLTGESDWAVNPINRAYLERYSSTSGNLLEKIDVTDWGISAGEESLKLEPEGVDGNRMGWKIGTGTDRVMRVLDLSLP